MLRSFSLGISLLLLAATAAAQQIAFTTPGEARKAIDGVMASFSAGNYDVAWKQLRVYSSFPQAEFDAFVSQFTAQAPAIVQRFGPAIGSEFIREDKAGSSLVRLTYLSRHERSGLRWYFILYRSPSGWTLGDFKFDSNLNAIFPGSGS